MWYPPPESMHNTRLITLPPHPLPSSVNGPSSMHLALEAGGGSSSSGGCSPASPGGWTSPPPSIRLTHLGWVGGSVIGAGGLCGPGGCFNGYSAGGGGQLVAASTTANHLTSTAAAVEYHPHHHRVVPSYHHYPYPTPPGPMPPHPSVGQWDDGWARYHQAFSF